MDKPIADVVIELHGAADSSRRTKEDLGPGLDLDQQNLTQYRARQKQRNEERRLSHFMQGVQDASPLIDRTVIGPTIDEVARLLDNGFRLGGVFIAGFSLGTWYAIIMADALGKLGVDVTFVGLSDMPLFPYGLSGTVLPGCDTLKPIDGPGLPKLDIHIHYPPRAAYPPEVNGPTVRARHKRNYYQNGGNGVVPRRFFPPLWWSSNMAQEEIHGVMRGNGWRNTEIAVDTSKVDDNDLHNDGDAMGMTRLGADIARGLGLVWELTGAGLQDF